MTLYDEIDYDHYQEMYDHYGPGEPCTDCWLVMEDRDHAYVAYPQRYYPELPQEAWDGLCVGCFEKKWDKELFEEED